VTSNVHGSMADLGGLVTGPDDIDAAIEIVRRLLAEGRGDGTSFDLTIDPRLEVNNAVLLALCLLVRGLITARAYEVGDISPPEYVELLLDQLREALPFVVNNSTWTSSLE
jgi:hypothetical protein